MFLIILFSLNSQAALRIAIDPGHGGTDKGATYGRVNESKVALQISQHLYNKLKKSKHFKPFLLRKDNHNLPLEDRVTLSEKLSVDLFVSIHANSNTDHNIKGAEFYIQNQMPSKEENLFLANRENNSHGQEQTHKEKIHSGPIESILYDLKKTQRIIKSYQLSWYLRKNWPQKERRQKRYMIRQGPFYVLSQAQTPAVLIEVGYLSHNGDRAQLADPQHQQKLAQQIYLGLVDYMKNMDKSQSPALNTSIK